ncbi:MAG: prepilin-type N-terminal cleavage/methylation domain-containing protein [Actinobacteria bacterium]|nr:prepilin-type N-terminal cleavage/methylation domain-containing protein [Actinomycetota bacterium]
MSAHSMRHTGRYAKHTRRRTRGAENGMTLVEVLISLVLLMLVLVPAALFLVSGINLAQSSSIRTTAISIASGQVSKLRTALSAFYPPMPAICNPYTGTGNNPFGGALTSCGTFQQAQGELPASERVGAATYTISYQLNWASSPSYASNSPSSSCASPSISPYPAAMVNVVVDVGYMLHNHHYSVSASALIDTPSSYYSPSYGYVAVYGGSGSSGKPVYLTGNSVAGYETFVSQYDSNGCAFFINVNAASPNSTNPAIYEAVSPTGAARNVVVCTNQTSVVPLYTSGVGTGAEAGGFGGCGALSAARNVHPEISVTPTSLTLTDSSFTSPGASKSVTVTDIGTWPLTIASATTSGPNGSTFAVTSGSSCVGSGGPVTINPGQTCTISVDFQPNNTSVYTYYGTLGISSDATNNQDVQVSLKGIALDCYEQVVYGYGPTAYWTLTGTTPPTAIDVVNTNDNGTMGSGVTTNQPGPLLCDPSAPSVALNGSSSAYITTPIRNFSPNQLTVEAWIRPTGYTGNPRIVANAHTDVSFTGFQLEVNNGGWSGFFDVGNGSVQGKAVWSMSRPLPLNQWYFYVGVYNGSSVTAYLDGAAVGSFPFSGGAVAAAPYPITIGMNPAYNADNFEGDIGQVAVYTTALTPAQIMNEYSTAQNGNTSESGVMAAWSAACYANSVNWQGGYGPSTSPTYFGPDAFWRLDEQQGGTAYNSSGQVGGAQPGYGTGNYNGTIQGGVSYSNISPPGALACDPTDNSMTFSQNLP